jgi:hypothetical protein
MSESGSPDLFNTLFELQGDIQSILLENNRTNAWSSTAILDSHIKTLYLEKTKREIDLRKENSLGKQAYSGRSRTYICGCGSKLCKLCLHFTRKDTNSPWQWRRPDRQVDEMKTELLHSNTCMAKGKIRNFNVAKNMILGQQIHSTNVGRMKTNDVSPMLRRSGLDFGLKCI